MAEAEITRNVLMYFILPLWLLAGFADWLCHRATDIAHTSGVKETIIHLIMFVEMAIPVTAAMQFEINALILWIMLVCLMVHEGTAIWDVVYAHDKRYISPIEQHVHNYLGLLPFMSFVLVVILNWNQFLSMWGLGPEKARYAFQLKDPPLPWSYVLPVLTGVLFLEVIPYLEELWRGVKARDERVRDIKQK